MSNQLWNSSPSIETFLARLYTDATVLERFLANPESEARSSGLADADVTALCCVDRAGLRMAAASYASKREQHNRPRRQLYRRLLDWLGSYSIHEPGIVNVSPPSRNNVSGSKLKK
jgi:hypothetical protein